MGQEWILLEKYSQSAVLGQLYEDSYTVSVTCAYNTLILLNPSHTRYFGNKKKKVEGKDKGIFLDGKEGKTEVYTKKLPCIQNNINKLTVFIQRMHSPPYLLWLKELKILVRSSWERTLSYLDLVRGKRKDEEGQGHYCLRG